MKSRDRIIQAAILIFASKGRHGAHMEEIAGMAKINKAMIYYIFHSKDELYFEVLKHILEQAWLSFSPNQYMNLETRDDFRDSLSYYISSQMAFFIGNRDYTRILVDAMGNGAEEIPIIVRQIKDKFKEKSPMNAIKSMIEKGKILGYFRNIDTDQFIISLTGAVIMYFLTHSLSEILDIEISDEDAFLEERKKSIIDLLLNGLFAKD